MIPDTLVKIGVKLLSALAIMFAIYSGYAYIKNIGYQEAEQVYLERMQKREIEISAKIDSIEMLSNILVKENRDASASLSADMYTIISKVKGKTLTVIKDGECTPSKTFSDSIVEINKRANQAVKGSQK